MITMRRLLGVIVLIGAAISCAHAQTAVGRLGSGLPVGTAVGVGGTPPPPGPITDIMPTNGSLNVSITPALSFASTNATSYFLFLGAVGSSSDLIPLPAGPTYSPTLTNSTSYNWQACATNAAGTTCSSTFSFTTIAAAAGSAPANVTMTFPSNGATGTSVTPTLTCSADSVDSYAIKFGTTNPPTTSHSLGADCSYPTGTLSYSTTYYAQAVAANSSGSTSSSVVSFTTRADPGPASFVSHPRLLLTAAKKTELSTKRVGNTAEWAAMKAYVDAMPAVIGTKTTLSSSLGTGGAGTTFTVTDGSAFPSGSQQLRIDLELLTASRSGNTFTVVSRSDIIYAYSFGVASHANGTEVWANAIIDGYGAYAAPIAALMEHAGQTGYTDKARAAFGQLMVAYGQPALMHDLNRVRAELWEMALSYDWVYSHLTASEIAMYAPILEEGARWHLDNLKWCIGGCITDPLLIQASTIANIGNGQMRAALALSAAVYGDAGNALIDWTDAYSIYNDSFIPALATGPLSGGNEPEGTHYADEVLGQAPMVLALVNSAIGEDSWGRVPGWDLRMAKYQLYSTQPGGRNHYSGAYTTGSISAAGTSLTVADASTFAVGDTLYLTLDGSYSYGGWGTLTVDATTATDVLPSDHVVSVADVGCWLSIPPLGVGDGFGYGYYTIQSIVGGKWRLNQAIAAVGKQTTWWTVPVYGFNSVVMAKASNTLTLRDPAPCGATNGIVGHQANSFAFGDIETYNNFDDFQMGGGDLMGMAVILDQLRTTNATYAGYLKYLMDHALTDDHANLMPKAIFYDGTVTALDFTGASLATIYSTAQSTANSNSTGMIIGMSDWTKTATWVDFLVGGQIGSGFDHATHYLNSYGLKRKGVWLTSNLHGYGATNLHDPPPHLNDQGLGYGSAPYVGWRYHNTIAMNGHGASIFSGIDPFGPAVLSRSDVQTTYFYGRGNAGDPYRYGGNNARIFQRDFFYLKPDLIAFADYVTYAAASVSPTTWFLQFTGNPSLSSQRITATYSTQKIVQDVLLPTSATFTKVSHAAEDYFLQGYRYEVQSGVSASSEYFCSVAQAMDSGDTPLSVTTLTTTNACVVEVAADSTQCPNACVIGFVKGTTPTLPISWTYSAAAPVSYIFGLDASTAVSHHARDQDRDDCRCHRLRRYDREHERQAGGALDASHFRARPRRPAHRGSGTRNDCARRKCRSRIGRQQHHHDDRH
jgi:hypothetical protein